MKIACFAAILLLTPLASQAQLKGARDYTKRVAPLTAPAPKSYNPGATPAPGTAQPAAPVDPEKVKAEKAATDKNLLEYQKKKAAEGSPNAQYSLGVRYLAGDGVEKNKETAVKWLEKASKQGNNQATKKLEELKAEPKKP